MSFSPSAARYALAASASSMQEGAPVILWDSGNMPGTSKSLQMLFQSMAFHSIEVLSDTLDLVVVCARTSGRWSSSGQGAWRQEVNVKLPLGNAGGSEERQWCIYPGLFASGGLDIMTSILLRTLPDDPPAGAKILDFACGS